MVAQNQKYFRKDWKRTRMANEDIMRALVYELKVEYAPITIHNFLKSKELHLHL
jgi:hypothetical protein